ncbi:hypothetical protein TNCV_420671 [Trichonephila clavipes]|nr:hypothetical protein TNCV_420671 [Trichonephila clavipes]
MMCGASVDTQFTNRGNIASMVVPYIVVPSALPETKESRLRSDVKKCINLNPSSLSKSILKSPPSMSGST